MRRILSGDEHQIDQRHNVKTDSRKVQRGGTVYTQRAENIGKRELLADYKRVTQ